jgi:4-amino-4-deoxy-L-arabinose transferase-like glycosyltransferase
VTTLATPTAEPRAARLPGHERALPRLRGGAWVLPATAGVLLLATALYVVNLTVSGYANVYYSAAAWAASQSWSAWFFGSVDPANFITVDKPPLATMVMGLSVRLFGLSSWSILLPQALMGVATVGLTIAAVRRTFGDAASIIAGLVTALTPAAVLMFRYNNPDALLTLLLVAAAWALVRALETDRFRWLVLSGVLVGLGFETKLLQAYLVLPAFAVTYAIAGPGSIRRRLAGLLVAAGSVVLASAWWLLPMELLPASARPYAGGSTNGSALDLVLGYDGLGRIFGQGGGGGAGGPGGGAPGGGGGPGGGFSGTPGLLRLFNGQLGGQIAWLLPLSLLGFVAGLVVRARRPRTDLVRAGFLLWGLWLLVHAAVFSLMTGIIHSYYVVAMAPAIGALAGGGIVGIWRERRRTPWAGLVLGLALLGSAAVAWMLLDRTPAFAPGLGVAVLALAAVALVLVAAPAVASRPAAPVVGAVLGIGVLLAGPAAYAVETMQTAYGGGDPAAGPQVAGEGLPGGFGGGPGGVIRTFQGPQGAFAGGADSVNATLADYLVANQGSAKWIAAVSGANSAGQLELATGRAVMAMGGFSGGDAAPTLEQLKALIASGDLRFVIVDRGGGLGGPGGFGGGRTGVSDWVRSACTAVDLGSGGNAGLYDCSAAAT